MALAFRDAFACGKESWKEGLTARFLLAASFGEWENKGRRIKLEARKKR